LNHLDDQYSYGDPAQLYVEYMRRTELYTMDYDHYHDYYEMYYMLSGQRLYFIRDRTYSVEQGDLVFINKHELHKTMHAGGSPSHERVILHFTDVFFEALAANHGDLLRSPFLQAGHIVRLPPGQTTAPAACAPP
jgi:hypothetical protein